jgi:hypothetical protein
MVIYQQLQTIAPRIGEQENVAALRIAAQMVAHQTVQTIKSLPHVRGSGGHVDPRRWPKSEHRPIPCPTPSTGASSVAPSKPRFTSILRPLVKPTTSALLVLAEFGLADLISTANNRLPALLASSWAHCFLR